MRAVALLLVCAAVLLVSAGRGWAQSQPYDPQNPDPRCLTPAPSDPDVAPTPSTTFGTTLRLTVTLNPTVRRLVPARIVARWLTGPGVADLRDPRPLAVRPTRTTWGRAGR